MMYVGGYVMSCLCDVIRVGGMVAGCMCCWCWRYTRTSGTQFEWSWECRRPSHICNACRRYAYNGMGCAVWRSCVVFYGAFVLFANLEMVFVCWFCGDYMVNLVKADNLLTLFNKTFFF